MKITKPNSRIETKTIEPSPIPILRIRNRIGCETGFGGGVKVRAFIRPENAAASRINPPKIAIMIRGNPSASMNAVEIAICTSAPTQTFAP